MASSKEYGYQIRGNKFSIVERDVADLGDGLNYTYPGYVPGGDGLDISPGGGVYKSPLSDVTDGIELEYTSSVKDEILDESSVIPVPDYLATALVYYVKAKLAEDALQFEAKEYFQKEFHKILEKHESSKVTGARQLMSGQNSIR